VPDLEFVEVSADKLPDCGSRETSPNPCPACEENDTVNYMLTCREGKMSCDVCGAVDYAHGCKEEGYEAPGQG